MNTAATSAADPGHDAAARCPSRAGGPGWPAIVMLFHSPMSRMNRTLPEAVDGESEPKTASWRAHHGAMTSRKTATAADRRGERDARGRARAAADAPGPPAVPQEDEAERRPGRAGRRCATASRARRAARPARTNARVTRPRSAARGHPERRRRPAAGRARSCRAGPCTRSTGAGIATRIAGADRHERPARRRRGRSPRSAARRARRSARTAAADAHATSPKTARNGTWTIDASGIQWAFEGIGRVGIGRDRRRRPRGRSR